MASASLFIFSALFIIAGLAHFRSPTFFLKITPKWVPQPKLVNWIVGASEVILGALILWPATRSYAAIAIILLLILVFPANVNHFQKAWRKKKMVLLTLVRLPFQALLIWWAYSFV